jgi:uncharacterized damage-inducible protein DinB
MSTEAQRVAAPLKRYFAEKHGVFLNFAAATDGLTAAQALHVPQEKFNSVWRVVNHVTYWQEAALLVLEGANIRPETAGYDTGGWHAPETADDATWVTLRTRAIEVNAKLADAIAVLDDEALHREIAAWRSSPFQIAESMIAHNSYHTCEIITVRHLQGLWVEA